MITLGYIKQLNEPGSNLVSVRIPLLEQAGINEEAVFSANIGHEPGSLNGYSVGDCVVVGFLNNTMDTPIVLGKLYTGKESNATNFSNANSLTVTESATLPANTIIGGVSFLDMATKLNTFKDVKENVDSLVNGSSGETPQTAGGYGVSMQVRQEQTASSDIHIILCVKLHGFTCDDIGKKLYLFRTTRGASSTRSSRPRCNPRGYKHPSNDYAYLAANGSIQPLGYFTVASSPNKPAVPSWMSGGGTVRTEWEIDEDMIRKGELRIDISVDWTSLLSYDNMYGTWSRIAGSSRYGCGHYGGSHHGCMKIKFGVVGKDSNTERFNLLAMTPESLFFGIRTDCSDDAYTTWPSNVTTLRTNNLYIKVE